MDSVVQRLHRALVEALARHRPDFEAAPVTVAEIYQELVPYPTARSSIGFQMNADYEHALLRLLAGEEALVRLEPEDVRATLELELDTPNPDVALFRQYAGCDVWVSRPAAGAAPAAGEDPGDRGSAVAEAHDDYGPEDAARDRGSASYQSWSTPEREHEPAVAAEEGSANAQLAEPFELAGRNLEPRASGAAERKLEREMPRGDAGRSAAAGCSFCRAALPVDRPVRYCPYCGGDQQLRPCARCGGVLEPGWRYCVSCGAPTSPTGG